MPARTLRSCFRELASSIRGIAGDFGVRPYRVYVETSTWTAAERGQDGGVSSTSYEITEGTSGNPPKVRWLNDFDIAFSNIGADVVRVGPFTPDWDDELGAYLGGNKLSDANPNPVSKNSVVRVRLVGPKYPDGALFRIRDTSHDRGYQYVMTLERVSEGSVIA